VYLKKYEPILLTGLASGRAKTNSLFRPPRQEAEAERQTTKEPGKISARKSARNSL